MLGDQGLVDAVPLAERIKAAWIQEAMAPELLPYQEALVTAVVTALDTQREATGGPTDDMAVRAMANIYQMEVDRIKARRSKWWCVCSLTVCVRSTRSRATCARACASWKSTRASSSLRPKRSGACRPTKWGTCARTWPWWTVAWTR